MASAKVNDQAVGWIASGVSVIFIKTGCRSSGDRSETESCNLTISFSVTSKIHTVF